MANEPICNGVYQLDNKETIWLPITIPALPETVEIEGCTLKRRSQLHISLVCMRRIKERYDISADNFSAEVAEAFCVYTAEHSVVFVNFKDEFRFVSLDEQRTLVVMAEVSNLNGFFDEINKKYSLALEYPPIHVTLYGLDGPGIFLMDSGDIKERTKIVPNPNLALPS